MMMMMMILIIIIIIIIIVIIITIIIIIIIIITIIIITLNNNVINSEAFKYKNKIIGNTYNVAAGAAGHDANKVGTQAIELATIKIPGEH